MFLKKVGARLKHVRKSLNMNQERFALLMGASRASYSLYENGKLPIDIRMLSALHEATGFSFDYLLCDTDDPSDESYKEEECIQMPRELTVSATGVVKIDTGYETDLRVNGEDMIAMIDRLVEAAHPKTDHNNQFAGRVTITVELLGDLEEET